MSVATSKRALKQRLDHYLWRNNSPSATALRGLIEEHFLPFERVAIIGGMVRDFARAGKGAFKSDVDLVIDTPAIHVENLAIRLNAKPNRFGGYSCLLGHWKIDFWALQTTWASKEGHSKVHGLQDLIGCTFFDWDAVLYDIRSRKILCNPDYFDTLRRGKIDINLLPNPSINGNLLRAIRRILLWDIEPGPRLHAFILKYLSNDILEEITKNDYAIYGHSLLSEFSNSKRLIDCVDDKEKRNQISTKYARQLNLPGIAELDCSSRYTAAKRIRLERGGVGPHRLDSLF